MEPANQQQQFFGFYSSLLFQPDYYKVSNNSLINAGIILENWASRGSNMLNEATSNDHVLLSNIKPENIPADSFPNSITEFKESQFSLSTQPNNLFSNYFCSQYDSPNLAQNNLLYSNDVGNTTSTSSASCKLGFTHLLNLSNSESCLSELQHPLAAFKDSPSTSSNQSTAGKKRAVKISESNSYASEAKKQKASSTSPSSPLKKDLKKEKVREKIATLQRLIAPYGKTDTASVLTETIGYIQFLHDQLQTLGVAYIRSPSCCNSTSINQHQRQRLSREDSRRRDLSSRGLCLVPVSSASFFDTCSNGF